MVNNGVKDYKKSDFFYTFKHKISLSYYSKRPNMKNRNISHTHEEAKIYQQYYKPSFNVLRLIKSVLSVFISGSSPAAHGYNYNKKIPH